MTRAGQAALAVFVCALLPVACGGENRIEARVACYPGCLALILQRCPLISSCNVAPGTDQEISDPDLRQGVATCFASGERMWQATNATSGDSTIVVKHADGTECYTAISAGSAGSYAISVGGQAVAQFDVGTQMTAPTVTCFGTTSEVVATPDCSGAPWTTPAACEQLVCTFGALPPGAATNNAATP
jgi:hypothetical protein